jgi:predicted N-acetyltransferase YhbS
MATDGDIYVVQAKDISTIETLEKRESERSVELDGVRRIRKKRNYRERPIYVMDNNQIYIDIIGKCEDIVHGCEGPTPNIKDVFVTLKIASS